MKSIKIIIIASVFLSSVSFVHAQKTFTAKDVIDGKTISQLAKEWDVDAFNQTKEVYTNGMTKDEFISSIRSSFPSKAPESLKDVFIPYYEYIYSLHTKGLTESQVGRNSTGNEAAELLTGLSSWNAEHPGILPECKKWPWKKIIEMAIQFLTVIFNFL